MSIISSTNKNKFFAYLTFLLWPFLGLLLALSNIKTRYARHIIWFFCAFFGFTFIVPPPDADVDANRYKWWIENLYAQQDKPFWDLFMEPYQKGIYSSFDIYGNILTLTLSRFTNSFQIMMGFVALVYGYFFAHNITYIQQFTKQNRLAFFSILLLAVVAFIVPFWNINGYRFYTALHVFFFGILRVLVEDKKRYYLICLFTPLIHGSFVLVVAVSLVYLIFGNRYYLYLLVLLGSLFFMNLNPNTINENVELAPIFLQNKLSGYSSKAYIQLVTRNSMGMNWYVYACSNALKFCIYFLILITYIKRKVWLNDSKSISLFSFGVLLLSMANYVSSFPSGGRFFDLANLMLYICFLYISIQFIPNRWNKILSVVFAPPLILFLLVTIRIGFDFIGLNTLLLNPFIAPFIPDSLPLIDYLK